MSSPGASTANADGPHHPTVQERACDRPPHLHGGSLRVLIVMIGVGSLGWSLPNTAAATLGQALVAEMDPARKVQLFAIVSTCGAVAAMIMTILGGTLSDRNRSRFGRRAPWILGGAVIGTLALFIVSCAATLPALVFGYALFQGALNASVAGLNAVTADRVPQRRLGTASSIGGLGYLLGLVLGASTASALIDDPRGGFRVIPWALLVALLLFVVCAPDRDSRRVDPPRFDVRTLLPPLERDFLLAFAGRFLSILALLLFNVYGLFLAEDYLHLPRQEAARAIAVGTALLGAAALLSTVIGGVVSDRIRRRKPIVAGCSVLMGAGVLPLLLWPSVGTLWLFMALAGAGYGAYLSVDAALMVEVLPSVRDAGKDLGFLALGNTAPVVIAPAVTAVIVSQWGYPILLVVLASCAVLGGAAIFAIRKVR